jgi:hypothetical protein
MRILFLSMLFVFLSCKTQSGVIQKTTQEEKTFHLTISPIVNMNDSFNAEIIATFEKFLQTKDSDYSSNPYWAEEDFQRYYQPYGDFYGIESSMFGRYFYQPTIVNIIQTEEKNSRVVKIAYIGYHPETKDNIIKVIFNVLADKVGDKIFLRKPLIYNTKDWEVVENGSIYYVISPLKKYNKEEAERQQKDIFKLCNFFEIEEVPITYYSCIDPVELFQIKGYDYIPNMYFAKKGGLAENVNLIFSGNNSEFYTHEISHIYMNNSFQQRIPSLLDEGLATYIGGSGTNGYSWHRAKMKTYMATHPEFDFSEYLEAYSNIKIEDETPIAYMTGALICENILRNHGKEKMFELFKSGKEIWEMLKEVNITQENLNIILKKELELDHFDVFNKG